jgi:methyl-accepting chemotaxis protein
VVASEVRALAGRSATAAREIKGLIQSSIEKVESGTQVVTRAGEIMQDVVGNAGQASGLMGTLADSARSQSRSIGEVESAVQALDSATQQNAALVEQTTSAATSLADSARQLSQEVSFFKLA